MSVEKVYSPGEVILDLSDPVPPYLILSGVVGAFVADIHATGDGYGPPLMLIRKGNALLVDPLVKDDPRSPLTLVALSRVVLHVPERRLSEAEIRRYTANWADELYESRTMLVTSGIQRVAWLLAVLAMEHHEEGGDGERQEGRPVPPISQRLMANVLDLNRETLSRHIGNLARDGHITVVEAKGGSPKRRIWVKDPGKLHNLAFYGELGAEEAPASAKVRVG